MKILSMKLKYIIIAFAVLFPPFAQAQEQLIGLHGNPVIEQLLQSRQNAPDVLLKSQKVMTISPLWLPFFDDFTYDGPYPDSMRWEDNFAFVNSSFQKNPANRGVATLDALNAEGKLYAHASPFPFVADYLTSRPIRTDSVYLNNEMRPLAPNDSLYFSFFYQPQGMGEAPNRYDSLVLEFFMEYEITEMHIDSLYVPADTIWITLDPPEWDTIYEAYWQRDTSYNIVPEKWQHVWASHGMSIDDFYAKYGQWMAQVMIPITDEAHFRPDFRFRFRNYASLPNNTLPGWQCNVDHWNIDYVYLNCYRFAFDTTYQDISFVNPGKSLLENYTAVPYKQYAADPLSVMKGRFITTYTNLSNVSHNAEYKYRIYDPNGNLVGKDEDYGAVVKPIPPAIETGIQSDTIRVVRMFSSEPGTFTIKQTLINKEVEGDVRLRDSITFLQEFSDYFAYDDGVPKAGYGLSAPRSMLAVHFPFPSTSMRDTLKAVDIFFNTTPTRQSEGHIEYFKLMVWDYNNGMPGDTAIYSSDEILYGSEAGQFVRFPIKGVVSVIKEFLVGVQQSTAENINIGFDYSNNMRTRNMYKIYNDPWQTSFYEGCLMIRPVMGTSTHVTPPVQTPSNNITVFPNPLTSERQIYIQKPDSFDDDHIITLKIYDGVGKQCYESPYIKPEVMLNNLYNGMFIIKLYNHTTGETATTKLLITR